MLIAVHTKHALVVGGTCCTSVSHTRAVFTPIVQADSSCQLSATAGDTTDAAVDSAADSSSDNIEWLKWTGAAVLFVEGLLVCPTSLDHLG